MRTTLLENNLKLFEGSDLDFHIDKNKTLTLFHRSGKVIAMYNNWAEVWRDDCCIEVKKENQTEQ